MNCLTKIFGIGGFIIALGAVGRIDYCAACGLAEKPITWIMFAIGTMSAFISYIVSNRRRENGTA